ncbi:MAG: RbsD/FucU domain-containing protein [Acidobacteriaceae bacterium]
MISRVTKIVLCSLLAAGMPAFSAPPESWVATLKQELPLLGHRNWIVIVDSAYPLQTSPGVQTVETGASEQQVVRTVLQELSLAKQVRPVVFMDAELPFVPEQSAPGVTNYRREIHTALGSLPVHSMPHEQLIKTLGDAGSTFHVLVLKTTLTIPYTSVFLRLDCKYWSDASEQELRKAMKEHVSSAKQTAPQ